jgi:hypothetical protein
MFLLTCRRYTRRPARGIVLLNECGLDPGLDHMSAMEVLDKLRGEDAVITSFKSYTADSLPRSPTTTHGDINSAGTRVTSFSPDRERRGMWKEET